MLTLKSYNFLMEISYGNWFIDKMQALEREKGRRVTITEFAKKLGVSQPTLSSWINETRKPSAEAALKLAVLFDDQEILSILGYTSPDNIIDSSLPPPLKESFDEAVDEIEREYKTQGITDFSSPEALRIAKEILEDHGWTVTI
jgi:transcriptional regulator with XRE-family HTH domain